MSYNRLNRTSFQARLGKRLDGMKRKFIDNQLLLTAHPTDMLRVRVVRDERTQDLQTRTITANEVIPVILPPLVDVPLRRLLNDNGVYILTTAFTATDDTKADIKAYCPVEADLWRDDLLIRLWKDPKTTRPFVTVFQVKDELGTFGYGSILYMKYNISYSDEKLPSFIVQSIADAVEKRETLGW